MFADGVGGATSTTVRFQQAGGAQPLILLPVKVNGQGPFQFILDTGASTSLLSPELAGRLNVEPTGSREGQTAGGKVAVSLGRAQSLDLGGAILTDAEIAIVELGHIARAVGADIDGDLGYNFFKHFRLTIDYQTNQLHLQDPRRFESVGNSGALTEVPMRLAAPAKPLILVDTYINGAGPFQFAIDTGSSTSAISPELAAQFKLQTAPVGRVTTGGAQIDLVAATLETLQVGRAKIPQVPVVIGPFLRMLSEVAGAKLEGIIGYNFLRHFKVVMDYPNLTLTLLPA